jgi:hypothetical protein
MHIQERMAELIRADQEWFAGAALGVVLSGNAALP